MKSLFLFFSWAVFLCLRSPLLKATPTEANGPGVFSLTIRGTESFLFFSPKAIRVIFKKEIPKNMEEDFYFRCTAITQGEWEEIMGKHKSSVNKPNCPVDYISFFEANIFCSRLTERARREKKIDNEWKFTLPTIDEWDFFSKANEGDDVSKEINLINKNRALTYGPSLIPSISTKSNAWGIYDCFGTVSQWCLDDAKSAGEESGHVKGVSFCDEIETIKPPYLRKIKKSAQQKGIGIRIVLRKIDSAEATQRASQLAGRVPANSEGMEPKDASQR